jgi:catechol 2,3-dioxygenase-like lactoylglutathione lyase family enzyme
MIIDHIGLSVADRERSRAFYTSVLMPLGIAPLKEADGWISFGKDGHPAFWIGMRGQPQCAMHIAFLAGNREQVRRFYQTALAAGGTHSHAPSIMANYHPHFYAAMIFDPDGNHIEAVCHRAEP